MTITIEIATDNAAFEDNDHEVGRILTVIVARCLAFGSRQLDGMHLKDINGNWVGDVRITTPVAH